jgi:hypothetical protein
LAGKARSVHRRRSLRRPVLLGVATIVLALAALASLQVVGEVGAGGDGALWVEPQPAEVAVSAPAPGSSSVQYRLAAPADPNKVVVPGLRSVAWAFIDRYLPAFVGAGSKGTFTVESMIKPWIAADYLRRLAERGRKPSQSAVRLLTLMIVDSNDPVAEQYFQAGGGDPVILRLKTVCGLSRVVAVPGKWSFTELTASDAARYALCLADGRAAGPQWTGWLLSTMRAVRGGVNDQRSGEVEGGRWGIIDGLPASLASTVAIKNGWTSYVDGWHVDCLAIHDRWVLVAMVVRPGSLSGAAQACASIAKQLVIAVHGSGDERVT